MAEKNKEKPKNEEPESVAVTLFGGTQEMLPKELESMGLAGMVVARELPGVAPSWKPEKKGDMILGRCVDVRQGLGKFESDCAVFETAIPGGFLTVWLGADLKIKLRDPLNKVFSVTYDGTMDSGKGQPTKLYRVFEIQPRQPVAG